MIDAIAVLGLTIWASGVGLWILDRLIDRPDSLVDSLAMAVPLGLGILALASVVLGEFGLLNRSGFLAVFLIGMLPIKWTAESFAGGFPIEEVLTEHPTKIEGASCRVLCEHLFNVFLVLTLLGTLLTALAPVTDGDALCYHLQVPSLFLHAKSMTFEPDLHETVYPLVTEMLYAVGLAFRGPIACRLVHWVLGGCFAASVTAMARPVLGHRASWAGTIALLVPAVSNGMAAPLNDVSLAAFSNAALVAYFLWKDRPTIGSALLTGVLAGLAIGVKYPALVWVGMIGISMGLTCFKGRTSGSHWIVFTLAAVIIGGCWYLRAYHHTGNPVHPFFRAAFGGAGIDDVLDPIKRPMAVSPWNLLTAIVPMTLQPDRFDSFSHQFGPIFLLLVPAIFLLRMPGRLKEILAIGSAFLTLCLTQRQSMRFVLAAVGPMSVGAAWAVSSWVDRPSVPARCLAGIVVVILAFETAIAVGHARHGLSVVMGREPVETYLSRREPTYPVGRWIDANLPRSARIVGQEHRGFYLPRPYSMELAHRRRTGLGTHGEDGDELARKLRDDGFSHLLLCPPDPEDAVEFDPTLSRGMESWLSRRSPAL